MKISIIVGGRFHAFNLAEQLNQKNYLKQLITSYPKFYINDKFKVCNKNETPYKTPPVRVMDDYFNGSGSNNIIFCYDGMGSRLATG